MQASSRNNSSAHVWHQMLFGMMQGGYGEPNPLIALKESPLSKHVIGRRRYLPTNRTEAPYEPTLMTNLQTGQLHYAYDSEHLLSRHYSDVKEMNVYPNVLINNNTNRKQTNGELGAPSVTELVHYDVIEQYPIRKQSKPSMNDQTLLLDLIESFAEVMYDIRALQSNVYSSIVELPMLVESVQRFYQNTIQLYQRTKLGARSYKVLENKDDEMLRKRQDEKEPLALHMKKSARKRLMRRVAKILWSDDTIRERLLSAHERIQMERFEEEQRKQQNQIYALYNQIVQLRERKTVVDIYLPLSTAATTSSVQNDGEMEGKDPWIHVIPLRNASTITYPFTSFELEKHLRFLYNKYNTMEKIENDLINHTLRGKQWNTYQRLLENQLLLLIYRRTKQNVLHIPMEDSARMKRILLESRISIREKSVVLCVIRLLSDKNESDHIRSSLKRMLFVYLFQDVIRGLIEHLSQRNPFLIPNNSSLKELLVRRGKDQKYRIKLWKAVLPRLF